MSLAVPRWGWLATVLWSFVMMAVFCGASFEDTLALRVPSGATSIHGRVRGPEPLATLSEYRDGREFGLMFGMNLVTVQPAAVRIGDSVKAA
jgi:hypothetical protein